MFNQCVTLNYEVTLWDHTRKFTNARCTSNNLKCQHCSFLEDNISGIKECNVSICLFCASGTSLNISNAFDLIPIFFCELSTSIYGQ